MAGIRLKVSTDALKAKAEEISGQIRNIDGGWKQISVLIRGSQSYWQGDAGNQYRKYLKKNDEDVKKLLKRLQEHPIDLQRMAGIYVEAEQEAKQAASVLPDDVIV